MNIPGIFNFETLTSIIKEMRKGTPGNTKGEGRLLGGKKYVHLNGMMFKIK